MNQKISLFILCGMILLLVCGCGKQEKEFKEETYYCRKDTTNYLHRAELNSKTPKEVAVHIRENHSDTSKAPENLKKFYAEVCETKKYSYKENQVDYSYHCGNTYDTIIYTYTGTMSQAVAQLKDDDYECYTVEKSGNLKDTLKNKKWCNYYRYRFYYTFDDKATKILGETFTTETEYSIEGNKVIIHNDSYDTEYTYDEEKNILSSTLDYLFECENEETDYYLVKERFSYDGKVDTIMPKSGYYKDNEYKSNRVECTNGITATFDDDRKMLFPSENKKAECIVYFDHLQN